MRSLICITPGDFEYREIKDPEFAPGQTIIKVERVGVCGTDIHAFEGTQPYFNYPRILGHELAGEIIETDADGFERNEKVSIIPYFNCGKCMACRNGKPNCCVQMQVCGVHIDGGMVDYLSIPSYSLVHGRDLDLDQLALIEPLSIGAHAVRRASVKKNEFVLVVGAGPIGLAAMIFANLAGARVIALDHNDQRLQFSKDHLAIENTINGKAENILEKLLEITSGDMPSVVMDATGNLKAIEDAFAWMAHGGRYILVGLQKEWVRFSHPEFHKREATLMSSRNATRADFDWVVDSMLGRLIDPAVIITHRVGFDRVKDEFSNWLNPATGVIKAMISLD